MQVVTKKQKTTTKEQFMYKIKSGKKFIVFYHNLRVDRIEEN